MLYDSTAKQALTKSFFTLCDLAVQLGQALSILSLDPSCSGSGEITAATERVWACSGHLDQWFAKAKASCYIEGCADKSVVMQNNIIYIYYQ
jgi:hypothetical protein